MMDANARAVALRNIQSVVPSIVFDRLINILTMIQEYENDAVVAALSKASTEPTYTFAYIMKQSDHEETITPIREILDLCEGWLITSTIGKNYDGRVKWKVESLIGKELPK